MLRWKLRTFLIAVAVLAPVLAFVLSRVQDEAALNEFYGPGGVLDRLPRIWAEIEAGRKALGLQRLAEAEARFRSALKDIDRNIGLVPVNMRISFYRERFDALTGLADILVAQGRFAEAMPFHDEALSAYSEGVHGIAPDANMADDPQMGEVLKKRAACSREIQSRASSPK